MQLIEPQRGVSLLLTLHKAMTSSPVRAYLTPTLADVFVFTYPIYLIILYCMGWIRKQINYKVASLWIFINVGITTIINIGIQFFVEKSRPNVVLGLYEKTETVLHKYLPSSSFPSDHAAVSMSIAMATLLRGIQKKDKKFLIIGSILIIFSGIMCVSRIATAVHWPTDILGGILVGTIIPLFLSTKKISSIGEKICTWVGKKI